jgi:hypothetical protein
MEDPFKIQLELIEEIKEAYKNAVKLLTSLNLKIDGSQKASVKPILIAKVNYTATIEDRLGFKKAVIEDTCNQYHVIVIGEDAKETTFEIVK